jgi:hypothetical protein
MNPMHVWPMQVALSPDGRWLYTGGCARSQSDPSHMLSMVVDLLDQQVVGAIDLGPVQTSDVGDKVAVSMDGSVVDTIMAYWTQQSLLRLRDFLNQAARTK